MKTEHYMQSEMIEPAMMYIIGNLWKQYDDAEEFYKEDALKNLYMGCKIINKLAIICTQGEGPNGEKPIHFNLAAGNNLGKVSEFVREKVGFNPWWGLAKDTPEYKLWNYW